MTEFQNSDGAFFQDFFKMGGRKITKELKQDNKTSTEFESNQAKLINNDISTNVQKGDRTDAELKYLGVNFWRRFPMKFRRSKLYQSSKAAASMGHPSFLTV